ncbi:Crp/Fnr family transcriptional regulator [Filimonas effusa]|uniref:Crp/Fnr family transcriptional regulator n=1 Tax=Filimonas effusa TaxID=2508721 RepID=A0A4Q1D1E5_9BACT|nr:Crp/Fnr family transcriptional regulator [Filimonas effusa]RXK81678.1 Crp/Fnr family transcriptional regulator [Filimonas effusa]
METLFALLNSIQPLSADLQEYLIEILKTKSIKKKDYVLKAGHISREIYFIEEGLFKCFYLVDDRPVSSWFMKERDLIISVKSFFGQVASYESIQALENSVVHYISFDDLQHIYRRFPEFNFHGRILTQNYYILCDSRLYAMRTKSALQRYQFILQNEKDLIDRVPAKDLASYLGISEYTFSRIKKYGVAK